MNEELQALAERVKAIEEYLWPEDGPGGPTIFRELQERINRLDQIMKRLPDEFVFRKEFDDHRRRTAELEKKLAMLSERPGSGGLVQGRM